MATEREVITVMNTNREVGCHVYEEPRRGQRFQIYPITRFEI